MMSLKSKERKQQTPTVSKAYSCKRDIFIFCTQMNTIINFVVVRLEPWQTLFDRQSRQRHRFQFLGSLVDGLCSSPATGYLISIFALWSVSLMLLQINLEHLVPIFILDSVRWQNLGSILTVANCNMLREDRLQRLFFALLSLTYVNIPGWWKFVKTLFIL